MFGEPRLEARDALDAIGTTAVRVVLKPYQAVAIESREFRLRSDNIEVLSIPRHRFRIGHPRREWNANGSAMLPAGGLELEGKDGIGTVVVDEQELAASRHVGDSRQLEVSTGNRDRHGSGV